MFQGRLPASQPDPPRQCPQAEGLCQVGRTLSIIYPFDSQQPSPFHLPPRQESSQSLQSAPSSYQPARYQEDHRSVQFTAQYTGHSGQCTVYSAQCTVHGGQCSIQCNCVQCLPRVKHQSADNINLANSDTKVR